MTSTKHELSYHGEKALRLFYEHFREFPSKELVRQKLSEFSKLRGVGPRIMAELTRWCGEGSPCCPHCGRLLDEPGTVFPDPRL